MGTVSLDFQSVDTSEKRALLGGSSHAAGSSNEDTEQDDPGADGCFDHRLRGALQSATTEDTQRNGGRFPAENVEARNQILKFACAKGKQNNRKKSGRYKRRVTFAV
ncbi:hypothetical protein WH47_09704 [Habropoda laboriosa]|uniref:Uncharacterized protein n=2 Tax=Habropoda laboriosa TaxID=597456 RepID=A0A0L7QM53_9HYME|nr:hypothetical protein WH47_09704 [Habropoda laboriosa]